MKLKDFKALNFDKSFSSKKVNKKKWDIKFNLFKSRSIL